RLLGRLLQGQWEIRGRGQTCLEAERLNLGTRLPPHDAGGGTARSRSVATTRIFSPYSVSASPCFRRTAMASVHFGRIASFHSDWISSRERSNKLSRLCRTASTGRADKSDR